MATLMDAAAARRLYGNDWIRNTLSIASLSAALLLVAVFIHQVGGVDSGLTSLMMIPVLAGAMLYGARGALATALPAGVLISPYVALGPPGVDFDQPVNEWLIRMSILIAVGALAGIWQDRVRHQTRLREQAARIDPTTGLPNGVAFVEQVRASLADKQADRVVAAAIVRATDLAEITDVTGVESGDRILRFLATHLQQTCPEIHGAYRFSASELGIVIEASDVPALKRVARTLHDSAGASFEVEGAPVRVEPAVGLGHSGDDECEALELVRRARVALRRAQKVESDWVSYEPVLDESGREVTIRLIAQAEQALKRGEFELYLQPKVRLSDGHLAGCEALVRWRCPDKGLVPPGSFMPKLERTSLIDDFSRFVMRGATDLAHSGGLGPVSVNLAPRNLTDELLIDELIDGLRKTNTPGEAFEVEITEGALMREPETTIALLRKLRNENIGVSIDDFGTGYSSFAYLRRLPATNLKIDIEFVRPLEGDARARRLVLAMIESGHALGMSVTAEGVETTEQARILRKLGCDFGQGFLWSAPLPEPELREWINSTTFQLDEA